MYTYDIYFYKLASKKAILVEQNEQEKNIRYFYTFNY